MRYGLVVSRCRSGMRFLIFSAIVGVLSLACQQPEATPKPDSSLAVARQQKHEQAEQKLKAAYPGLQTIREAFPGRSFTIDMQDAAARGALLLARSSPLSHDVSSYDLERTADGHVVLSFIAFDEGYSRAIYFVQVQCSDEQANALREMRLRQLNRVVFRLTAAGAARPFLDLTPSSEDSAPMAKLSLGLTETFRVLRGTLVDFL